MSSAPACGVSGSCKRDEGSARGNCSFGMHHRLQAVSTAGGRDCGTASAGLQEDGAAKQDSHSVMKSRLWSTGRNHTDNWLQEMVEDETLLLRFGCLPAFERMEMANRLRQRELTISNFTPYFAGCITKCESLLKQRRRAVPYAAGVNLSSSSGSRPRPNLAHAKHTGQGGWHASGMVASSSPGSVFSRGRSICSTPPQSQDSSCSSASSVAAHGRSLPRPATIPNLAHWAKEALQEPRNKCRFLSLVCLRLDAETRKELQQLTPQWMYHIAMSVALVCREGVDANLVACQYLRAHADIGKPGLSQRPCNHPSKPSLRVSVIHLGSWFGLSQVAVLAALKKAAYNMQDVNVEVVEVHVFAEEELAVRVEEDVASATRPRPKIWPSIADVMTLVRDRGDSWKGNSVKVMLLSRHVMSWPDRSYIKSAPPDVNLHGEAMHLLWRHIATAGFVARHLGHDQIAQFFLTNSILKDAPKEPITAWLGNHRTLDPMLYKAPFATDSLYASPSFHGVDITSAAWDATQPEKGWRWASAYQPLSPDAQRVRLHAGIVSLHAVHADKQRELSLDEKNALQLACAVNTRDERTALFSVDLHVAMSGCRDLPVGKALRKFSPCCAPLRQATAERPDEAIEANAESCTTFRWCAACENVHAALFKLPHASDLCDHVAPWVATSVQAWSRKGTATFVNAAVCPQHVCIGSCNSDLP